MPAEPDFERRSREVRRRAAAEESVLSLDSASDAWFFGDRAAEAAAKRHDLSEISADINRTISVAETCDGIAVAVGHRRFRSARNSGTPESSAMQGKISNDEISVVVQGAIAGKPTDPPQKQFTVRCLNSVRRHLPGAEIVLSTWKGSDVSGLSFDKLVLSDDPGAIALDKRRTMNNINRQIVSTAGGLQVAEREYAVKLRTDFELLNADFLNYYGKFPARIDTGKVFQERVVASTVFSINPRRFAPMPFHPSDWFFFGRSEDLRNLWHIPLAPEPHTSQWCGLADRDHIPFLGGRTARFAPEQTMWLGLLRKHGDFACEHMTDVAGDAVKQTELTIANNLVLASPRQLGLKYLKNRRGTIWDFESFAVYTHGEWRRLYRRYCDPSASVPWFDGRGYLNAYLYFWYVVGSRMWNWTRRKQPAQLPNPDFTMSSSGR